jgi:hypothetical protein
MAKSLYRAVDRALSGYRMWQRIMPGRKEPDFVIGGSYNFDVTGGSATSIANHMGRGYYKRADQIGTYPALASGDIASIFGKFGRK